MGPHEADDDPRDEGPLADLTSGAMWTVAGVAGTGALLLPGADRTHLGVALVVAAVATGWGLISIGLWKRRLTMPIGTRAVATAASLPLVAVALWATGGASSFLAPLMLFTALFIAYFFPPRLGWPLTALFVATYATPLLYQPPGDYPSRVLTFVAAVAGMNVAIGSLKRRLLRAEARQRAMAARDALTGLHNRRAFDLELARAVGEPDGTALVLFDFDGFKAVNDELGHPVGDEVLRAVARACAKAAGEDECLARIGGDEFAVIAPGVPASGVASIVRALDAAIVQADLPAAVDGVRASFAWATAPHDGATAGELVAAADRRLLERKRGSKLAF